MTVWWDQRPPVKLTCAACGREVEQPAHGKPGPWPDYCSAKCRARAHRRRKAGAPLDTPPQTRGGLRRAAYRAAPPEVALVALTIPAYWLWAFAHSWLASDYSRSILGRMIWVAVFGGS